MHTIMSFFFFFNDTATTEIYTLSLHDALPISRKELVVDQGGLRIAELRCHVPSDSEVRILVDTAGDEDRDVATCLYGRQERGRGLEARVEDLADVVRVLEPEDCLRRREGDPFRDFHRDRVKGPDVLPFEA